MVTRPSGRVVKLDEKECNLILNGLRPDRRGFAKCASIKHLMARAVSHFLRLLDVLDACCQASNAVYELGRAREQATLNPRSIVVSIVAAVAKCLNPRDTPFVNDINQLITASSTGIMFFPDAVCRLRELCFSKGSVLNEESMRVKPASLELLGIRGGCGVRYFTKIAKYYRKPHEASALAFYPGTKVKDSSAVEFEWVIGDSDDDWVTCTLEFGVLLERPDGVSFRGGLVAAGNFSNDGALAESEALIMSASGIRVVARGGRAADLHAGMYRDVSLLKLLDVPGTVVSIVANPGSELTFRVGDGVVASVPLQGSAAMVRREKHRSPCAFVRFWSPRCEFLLSRMPPSFSSTHHRDVGLLSLDNFRNDPVRLGIFQEALGNPDAVARCRFYLNNRLSYGRSALKELECATKLYVASEDLANSMFRPHIRQMVSRPCPCPDTPTGLFVPVNFNAAGFDEREKNSVILYDSVYPAGDKKKGYGLLLKNPRLLLSFVRDVAIMGETCRRAGVVHNDMHGRNVLWRVQPCEGAPLLSLIDMDRSEVLEDADEVGRGVIKDTCTYIIECLFSAFRELGRVAKNSVCLSILGEINAAMSACLKTPSVFWYRVPAKGDMRLETNFDVVEKWNPSRKEEPPKNRRDWPEYYAKWQGQNFRVKPRYIRDQGAGARECASMLDAFFRISCNYS